jgi:predicted transposase YdaD
MNLSAAYLKKQQEWLEEGTERGIQLGTERGIEQSMQNVAIAALREGCPMELIVKLTGLTIPEIEQLQTSR